MHTSPSSNSALVDCPRCGSPRKQPLSADLYRCTDCGLHYHLDWLDGHVRVRPPAPPRPSPSARWDWLPLKVLLLVATALLLLIGWSFLVAPVGRP